MFDNSDMSPYTSESHDSETEDDIADLLFHMMLIQNQQVSQVLMKAFIVMTDTVISSVTRTDPIPYHTSILTGQMWVQELLDGHPDRIHNELGIQKHIFKQLINELTSQGFTSSRHVTIEEQLSIFCTPA